MASYEFYSKLRNEKGLNDSQVSKITGIGRSTFTDWKNGRSTPKRPKIVKIAEALGVSPDVLDPIDYFAKKETEVSGFVIKGGIGNPVISTINFPQNIHISAHPLLAWLMRMKETWIQRVKDAVANEDYAEAFSAKETADAYEYVAEFIKAAINTGAPEWWFENADTHCLPNKKQKKRR